MNITPQTLDSIARAAPNTLTLASLEAFTWDQLNALRWRLAQRNLREDIEVEGAALSVDQAIDRIVARMLGDQPGMRLRAPHAASAQTWAKVRSLVDPDGDALFLVDEEREPLDPGLMFDMYEEYIYADEY